MRRDTTDLKGSLNAVIGLNKFSGGQLWVEDPKGNIEKAIPIDKLTKDGPTKVLGRLVATSEKAVTFDGRKWHCVEPTRDERLTIACYTPCGIRHAKKGTRRVLKRLGFVLPRRRNSLLGSAPGIRTVPAMPCVEASVQEHNERIAKEEEEIWTRFFPGWHWFQDRLGGKKCCQILRQLRQLRRNGQGSTKDAGNLNP